jgi:hypothetical protein
MTMSTLGWSASMHDELPSRVRELEVRCNLAQIDQLPERLGSLERAIAPVPELQAQLTSLREVADRWRSRLMYGAGTIILSLVFSGKMTIGEAVRLIGTVSRLYYSLQ